MNKLDGLLFFEKAVPKKFQELIEEWFKSPQIQEELFPITKHPNSRKVVHYGYKYDYNSKGVTEQIEEFPHIIEILRDSIPRIWEDYSEFCDGKGVEEKLNQCIINRYLPGQGISPHIDKLDYGNVIVCFTFLFGREMEFTFEGKIYKIYTPPGSMYVMTGESRYKWRHQMKSKKIDVIDGKKIPREECFSITFREV